MKNPRFISILITLSLLVSGSAVIPGNGFLALAQTSTGKKNGKKTSTPASKTPAAKKGGKKSAPTQSAKKNTTKKGATKKETAADVRKRHEATQKEIAETRARIRENEKSIRIGVNELGKLSGEISVTKSGVETMQKEVEKLSAGITGLESSIITQETELSRLREEYLKAVKKMRTSAKGKSGLAFIFSSRNFNEAMRRMRYLRKFSEWRGNQSEKIAETVKGLKKEKELLAATIEKKNLTLGKQQKAQKELEQKYARQDAIVAELRKNGTQLNEHLARKQSEANDLKNRVASLIAAEQAQAEQKRKEEERRLAEEKRKRDEEEAARKRNLEEQEAQKRLLAENSATENDAKIKTKGKNVPAEKKKGSEKKDKAPDKKLNTKSGKQNYAEARKRKPRTEAEDSKTPNVPSVASKSEKSTSTPKKPSGGSGGSFDKMRGSLPRPVAGSFKITSPFGRHSLPELPDVMYDNPGIDAETAKGATALAVFDGTVSGIYMVPGFNTIVIVNHGNYYTVYGNIASSAVKKGDNVKQGQALGKLAADQDDPSHTSIHFEVWKNRDKLNPMDWIR